MTVELRCNSMISITRQCLILPYNFIKDDDIAQDVMQEAFIKAFKKIDTYTGEAQFWFLVEKNSDQSKFRLVEETRN